jgi:inositol oxygenase
MHVIEQWDEFVAGRYREGKTEFRAYDEAPEAVRDLYRLNHERQTFDFVLAQHQKFRPGQRDRLSMWETLEKLNELVDDSDPDTDLPQIAHALQTAEKIRREDGPDWMQLVGLIHDAGKMLCFYGEPQWAVVGDTFPVGCAWSDRIVYHEYFANNPDRTRPELQTELGVYNEGCGLERVQLSWGHDEYLYRVLRDSKFPQEALAMVRYHSFYPWHREGAYRRLMDASDEKRLGWVQAFNPYDLYSKSESAPDVAALRPYYQGLINRYLPAKIAW